MENNFLRLQTQKYSMCKDMNSASMKGIVIIFGSMSDSSCSSR